ncbi:hypothetical protein FA15DRAFT_699872 [Coprinopsis marcescibilis]|uniref:Carbohydrate-binding module family 19 domain-containing protein n=1 Tax=Coprinopsis marcescibilis TaxID=230819 RepID=A0A5C3L992_COPMA|nr:hypothetical protein FA15DRAFT_699872 [Coprinopsis marcescibilis]
MQLLHIFTVLFVFLLPVLASPARPFGVGPGGIVIPRQAQVDPATLAENVRKAQDKNLYLLGNRHNLSAPCDPVAFPVSCGPFESKVVRCMNGVWDTSAPNCAGGSAFACLAIPSFTSVGTITSCINRSDAYHAFKAAGVPNGSYYGGNVKPIPANGP